MRLTLNRTVARIGAACHSVDRCVAAQRQHSLLAFVIKRVPAGSNRSVRYAHGRERFSLRIPFMAQQKEIISTINSLIETLKDGQEGFKQAAEGVKDPTLKSLFNEYSMQRAKFAGELQAEAVQLGEPEPEESSSTAGAMHRAWINIKSAVTSNDDHAILAECERGEDSAVKEYKEALEDDISSPVRDIISRQYSDVQSAHDRIRSLRDATKTS